ncbi:MAG TPA: hypothetical protein VFK47_19955 [Ktedonobacteraceae bacterium]|nr:hypothetical protein [Ktedonobacteraceae bacterium]
MKHEVPDTFWITAPSGAGKTLVANELAARLGAPIVTDAAEMLALNRQDTSHKHHVHPNGDEAFLLTSSRHYDGVVQRLCSALVSRPPGKVIVELARGVGDNQAVDPSYKRLLGLIPSAMFARSAFVYVQAGFDQRTERNMGRRRRNFSDGLVAQSFFVPVAAMEGFYRRDDFMAVRNRFPCPTHVINNERMSLQGLRQQIDVLAARLGGSHG